MQFSDRWKNTIVLEELDDVVTNCTLGTRSNLAYQIQLAKGRQNEHTSLLWYQGTPVDTFIVFK